MIGEYWYHNWRWEKPQEGAGLNCVFKKNFSFLRSEELLPGSECDRVQILTWVQSLSAADREKREKKERSQAIIQVPSTNWK